MILPKYSLFFIDFRSRCYVTSGDVTTHLSQCEESGNKFWEYLPPFEVLFNALFLGYIATHARGLGRS